MRGALTETPRASDDELRYRATPRAGPGGREAGNPLLVAQRDERIDSHRAMSRYECRDHGDRTEEQRRRRERDGIERAEAEEESLQ